MKKIALVILVGLMFLLVACSNSEDQKSSDSKSDDKSSDKTVTVKIVMKQVVKNAMVVMQKK